MDQNMNGGNIPQNQNGGVAPTMPSVNMAAAGAPAGAIPTMPNMAMPSAGPIPQYGEKRGGHLAETIILVIVCLIAVAAIVGAVYFYLQWSELNSNFEVAKNDAVQVEVKKQQEADEKKYQEEAKQPLREWVGPSDYGSVSFTFPKTWSVYVDSDGLNNSDYSAYFAPSQIDKVGDKNSRYALRFSILNRQYSDVSKTYERLVQNKSCVSSVFNADDNRITGMKYEGEIDREIRGIVVVIKINDKTAVLRTDSEDYRQDFEALISTLRRNS